MRVKQSFTRSAAKQRAGPQCIGVREDVTRRKLLAAFRAAPLADKLAVEGIKGLGLSGQFIRVALDQLPD